MNEPLPSRAASLSSLTMLLHGLYGHEIKIQWHQTEKLEGRALRPVLTLTHLLLPPQGSASDGPDDARLCHAAVAHAVAHLRYSIAKAPIERLKPMGIAVVSAIEDARVERLLMRDYPGIRSWFIGFLRKNVKPAESDFSSLMGRMNLALIDPTYQDENFWVNKARRLFEEHATQLTHYPLFRHFASILANDLGQMRVPFRSQHYVVPEVYRDDNSFLWDFDEAQDPSSPALDQWVKAQSREVTDSQNSVGVASTVEIELARRTYPEWDFQRAMMRPQWCTVIEKRPVDPHVHPHDEQVAGGTVSLRHSLRRSQGQRQRLRRQWEGDEFDLDAVIEATLDRRLKISPSLGLYKRSECEDAGSSLLVLLDLSESTNDIPIDSTRSILEIEKEAALLLVQSTSLTKNRIAVHGFSSNTRAEVNYYRLLEFGLPLDKAALAHIRSMPGRFSTRMGVALRHALSCLTDEPFDQRAIVLLSDGAPSAIDVFRSDYLVEDARLAVLECKRAGIKIFCVALDPNADAYVRRIFGWNNYRIVDQAINLPAHLSTVSQRLFSS